MNKTNVTKFIKTIQNGVVKHTPEILTGIGIAGMITTTVLAVKATPKALKLIEEAEYAKEEKVPGETRKLTAVETVKVAWKPYIPAAVTGVASVTCLIGASSVNARRNAALATAYQISTSALNEYKDKVVETIGEEKEKEVREKIVEEKKENIANSKVTYIMTNDDITIKEPISNRCFESSINKVEKAVNDLNYKMINGMEIFISLNEFLDELGLPHSPIGDDIGWTTHKLIDLTFDDSRTDNNKPCFAIAYLQPPFHGYRDYY